MSVMDAKIDTLYFDSDEADEWDDGELRLDDNEIVLSYEDEDGHVIYRGKNNGNGHFALTCPERRGEATLHVFPEGRKLDGYWQEEGCRGMWRVHVNQKIEY